MKRKNIKIDKFQKSKISKPRESWDSAFKKMSKNKDDILLDSKVNHIQSSWDKKEWEW